MKALRMLGVPYTDDEIAKAAEEVKGKTELDARDRLPAGAGHRAQVAERPVMDINDLRSRGHRGQPGAVPGPGGLGLESRRRKAAFDEAAHAALHGRG